MSPIPTKQIRFPRRARKSLTFGIFDANKQRGQRGLDRLHRESKCRCSLEPCHENAALVKITSRFQTRALMRWPLPTALICRDSAKPDHRKFKVSVTLT